MSTPVSLQYLCICVKTQDGGALNTLYTHTHPFIKSFDHLIDTEAFRL